jgi:uncharacterized protein YndB with AHSA1/START domain
MSARLKVEATGTTTATPAELWPLLEDVTRFTEWGMWQEADYQREGTTSPHGVGAIRRVRSGRTVSIEEVVEVEPEHRVSYRLLSGIPVRDYLATVELTPVAGGTEVHWWATFERTLLGRVVRPKLQSAYDRIVSDLCAAGDRLAAGSTARPADTR